MNFKNILQIISLKGPHVVLFHLHEVLRVGKSTVTKILFVVPTVGRSTVGNKGNEDAVKLITVLGAQLSVGVERG